MYDCITVFKCDTVKEKKEYYLKFMPGYEYDCLKIRNGLLRSKCLFVYRILMAGNLFNHCAELVRKML